jgi:acetyl-CoA carboxylase/biotin carboxylase 1
MAWSGSGISDTAMSPQGFVTVPDDAYVKACVNSWEEGFKRAKKIGFHQWVA